MSNANKSAKAQKIQSFLLVQFHSLFSTVEHVNRRIVYFAKGGKNNTKATRKDKKLRKKIPLA